MKKALSLLLAGSMVFSLAACGGSKDTAGTTTDSTAASSDAAGSDTFKIGATGYRTRRTVREHRSRLQLRNRY